MIGHQDSPFGLENLLDECCATPEDFQEWNAYQEQLVEKNRKSLRDDDVEFDRRLFPYTGFMRYVIETHCIQFVVIARRRKNGTYELKSVERISR